jgi:hypothetical protein
MIEILFLLSVIAFILIIGKVAQLMLNRLEKIEQEIQKEVESEWYNSEELDDSEELKNENSSSIKIPKDFHVKQNLDGKFAKNVYRDKSGKFKSKKEWKNPQETY